MNSIFSTGQSNKAEKVLSVWEGESDLHSKIKITTVTVQDTVPDGICKNQSHLQQVPFYSAGAAAILS